MDYYVIYIQIKYAQYNPFPINRLIFKYLSININII